jgi:hypothetical protein
MSLDPPGYDEHALDAGDDTPSHECTRLRVRCGRYGCQGEYAILECAGYEESWSCEECCRWLLDSEIARAECACFERDDDERKERHETH